MSQTQKTASMDENVTARPLQNYVAIESIDQTEAFRFFEGTSIIKTSSTSASRFLRGIVLRKGPLVGGELSVGDEVLYESMSAHPSQSSPIDAEIFGGTPGRNAYVVPVYPEALLGTGEIEEEKAKRQREIDRLSEVAKSGWLNDVQRAQLGDHERRMVLLGLSRRGRARGSNPMPTRDPAKGTGVVAVILKEVG